MKRCLLCDSIMSLENDFNFEDAGINAEGITSFLYCEECDSLHQLDQYDEGHIILTYIKEENENNESIDVISVS